MANSTPVLLEHVPDTWLEQHCEGKLPEPMLSVLEEHLLGCEFCPKRLAVFREYAKMRASLRDDS